MLWQLENSPLWFLAHILNYYLNLTALLNLQQIYSSHALLRKRFVSTCTYPSLKLFHSICTVRALTYTRLTTEQVLNSVNNKTKNCNIFVRHIRWCSTFSGHFHKKYMCLEKMPNRRRLSRRTVKHAWWSQCTRFELSLYKRRNQRKSEVLVWRWDRPKVWKSERKKRSSSSSIFHLFFSRYVLRVHTIIGKSDTVKKIKKRKIS